ncbi:hypothetical protein SAICODRAFT_151015 [Saitoella complicata NRRL Y-17804]|uniref:uncharacterized protein n=1 Tax=Saitoella complicata (strain BCRC 22490 / CBS 7301 / JCM 7358 / NBRC 10748 / NRRL Y-17804) TaxID=698492 RepID=UPI000866DF7D|nr:uncharacterized protein SAICODRAFT_151015 [Saitoella complicata NRRL Y-17804]ODQ55741.1 hypothetical protein SAICODRAFT_151015 [Saitoella complicata NRRL Y-17804]
MEHEFITGDPKAPSYPKKNQEGNLNPRRKKSNAIPCLSSESLHARVRRVRSSVVVRAIALLNKLNRKKLLAVVRGRARVSTLGLLDHNHQPIATINGDLGTEQGVNVADGGRVDWGAAVIAEDEDVGFVGGEGEVEVDGEGLVGGGVSSVAGERTLLSDTLSIALLVNNLARITFVRGNKGVLNFLRQVSLDRALLERKLLATEINALVAHVGLTGLITLATVDLNGDGTSVGGVRSTNTAGDGGDGELLLASNVAVRVVDVDKDNILLVTSRGGPGLVVPDDGDGASPVSRALGKTSKRGRGNAGTGVSSRSGVGGQRRKDTGEGGQKESVGDLHFRCCVESVVKRV